MSKVFETADDCIRDLVSDHTRDELVDLLLAALAMPCACEDDDSGSVTYVVIAGDSDDSQLGTPLT